MNKVQQELTEQMPLALTPIFSFPDIEYADDTVIIAKVAEAATLALKALQKHARARGLQLNMKKDQGIGLELGPEGLLRRWCSGPPIRHHQIPGHDHPGQLGHWPRNRQ
eukprot:12127629-Alexandrium_andersonii.AAC.1